MWKPIDNALMKQKAHKAMDSEYDLFMTHRKVLKSPKKQRFTHDGRRQMHRILSPMSKHFDSLSV